MTAESSSTNAEAAKCHKTASAANLAIGRHTELIGS